MRAGDSAFTVDQRRSIDQAIAVAERSCGHSFSVWVGASEDEPREHAVRLHAQLPDSERSVLLLVDPTERALEIVTGARVRRDLDDASAGLAALAMQSSFAAGDLANGIVRGVRQLGEHARPTTLLHADQT